ncbi:MAG: transketolase [Deltaproteobacteria bacterium]|nr:transketolase [Deltaproteobacteria bacterium]
MEKVLEKEASVAGLDELCINTIRFLAVDAVEKANSGHPGMPMGDAPMAYVLWKRFLRHNPKNPAWQGRDRFVLSAGHGSMLLYSLLHLTGYPLPLDELKRFRQWESLTPGHPEYHPEIGIETTTGPLGQGFANGVGMGMAQRFLADRYNRPGFPLFDYHIYAITSDGDLMEGVSSEAASIAGHLGLGNIIYLYSDNRITIEGSTGIAFTEDVARRFEGMKWHVQKVGGNDLDEVARAIEAARAETSRPSIIIARTHIGFGSPEKQDTSEAHGSPLGKEEVRAAKENLGWPLSPDFHIPEAALGSFRGALDTGERIEGEWKAMFEAYAKEHPGLAEEIRDIIGGRKNTGWVNDIPVFTEKDGAMATRSASGKVLNAIAGKTPLLIGGSADLAPSTNTLLKGMGDFLPDRVGRNLHFGVREHAMGAILNGMAQSRAIIPYGATFLIFSDYMRPPIRLAAMMKLHVIYVFTHDSIGLGEDGPTHQPVEQLAALRAIPNLRVIRPSDATEVAEAWKAALLDGSGPVALILTRQNVPVIDRARYAPASLLSRGAYVLMDPPDGEPEVILIATGSEVHLALASYEDLSKRGVKARVVSMPSWEMFEAQEERYRAGVLPPNIKARVAIETASPLGWHRYAGSEGDVIAIERFGASAPCKVLFEKFGFTVENVTSRALALVNMHSERPTRGLPRGQASE